LKLLRLRVALLIIAIIPALLLAQSVPKRAPRRLLVISVAGLDARLLTDSPARVKIPNIRKLIRQGTSAGGVIGVAPSDTWSSAISLVTGVPPAEDGSPIWQAASKSGLRTAAVYWPNTMGAEIGFNFPVSREFQQKTDIPFDSVAQKASPAGIIDRVEAASPGFQKELWDDTSAARAAEYLLRVEKPDLLLVELTDIDSEQRETGALSIYARDALANDDDLIGQILAAAPAGTVVALVSGHGFENENYVVRPRALVKGPVEVEDGLIGTPDRAVAQRLRMLMNDGHRHGLAREVPMSEVREKVPAITKWEAAFDTPANYVASAEDRGPALGPGSHRGVSGLWPTRPGYRSVFVIAGEGVPARKLGEIDLLQIAPTLAGVIGVALPQAKRKSLWPL
jgi:predicted AlkP superfamily pyrophosphatase or phosphodiesterase